MAVVAIHIHRLMKQGQRLCHIPRQMPQPAKLVQRLGMRRVRFQSATKSCLRRRCVTCLNVDKPNLIQSVSAAQRRGRRGSRNDPLKELKRALVIALLLVDDAHAETDLIGALKIRRNVEHRLECLQRVVQPPVPVIKQACSQNKREKGSEK